MRRDVSEHRVVAARSLGVALFALVSSLGVPSAQAWCRTTTSQVPPAAGMCPSGTPLAWRRPCTRYHVFGTGSATLPLVKVREIFELSFAQWETIECDGVTVPGMPNLEAHLAADASLCDRSDYVVDGPNVSTMVFADDWAARGFDPSAYAVTTVWHNTRTGEIYDVDMEINEDGRVYADCPSPTGCADGRVDLQNVLTHEAGHYFGLAHSAAASSTMFASSPPGEVGKRILEADDIEGFCNAYPPATFDGAACIDTPRGGATLSCGPVEEEGCGCRVVAQPRGTRGGLLAVALAAACLVMRRRRSRGLALRVDAA